MLYFWLCIELAVFLFELKTQFFKDQDTYTYWYTTGFEWPSNLDSIASIGNWESGIILIDRSRRDHFNIFKCFTLTSSTHFSWWNTFAKRHEASFCYSYYLNFTTAQKSSLSVNPFMRITFLWLWKSILSFGCVLFEFFSVFAMTIHLLIPKFKFFLSTRHESHVLGL